MLERKSKVLFYLLQSQSVKESLSRQDYNLRILDLIKNLINKVVQVGAANKSLFSCLNNFVSLYLSESAEPEKLYEIFAQCGNPKHVIFEVACKHFRDSTKYYLLNKGLRMVLDTCDYRLEKIQNMFVQRSSLEKYLTVGLLLTEILTPLRIELSP